MGGEATVTLRDVFLETSGQSLRLFGKRKTRRLVDSALEDAQLYSSLYVWGEFITAFIHPAIIALNLARDPANETFGDVLKELPRYLPYQPRRVSEILQVLAEVSDQGTRDKADVADRLDAMITYQIRKAFMRDLQPLVNEVECEYAKWDSKKRRKGNTFDTTGLGLNKQALPQCDFAQFIASNWAAFQLVTKALAALDDADEEQKRAVRIADESLSAPQSVRCSVCRYLADVVISLECPSFCELLTQNVKHFSVTLAPLGKKWLLLPHAGVQSPESS